MKKLVLAVVAVLAAATVASGIAMGSGGSTVVAAEFPCGIADGDGNIVITYNSVLTLNSSGKAILQCAGYAGNSTGHLVNWNHDNTGAFCGMLQFGITDTWGDKVGSNGNSQLTCTTWVKDNAPDAAGSGAGIG